MSLNYVRVTGNDIIQIGTSLGTAKTITAFADGDYARLSFPNDIMNFTIGKNRNMIAAYNAMGSLAELELRLLRGCEEDKFLNDLFPSFDSDALKFNFIYAKIEKKLTADKKGEVAEISEKYTLQNGVISKAPEFISNVSGSTDQGVVVWQIRFAEFKREVSNAPDGTVIIPPVTNPTAGG